MTLLLGAHMSVAGGIPLACERGREVGCTAIQIFTKSERQWKAKPLSDEDAASFRKSRQECGIRAAFAHDSYLINLASPDAELRKKSIQAFVHELERCEALGLEFLVTHPGSPGEAGEKVGLEMMSRSINEVHRETKGIVSRILLETTAGQGATVGWKFEQMRAIRDGLKEPERIGFCVDTCHIFAAGYDISTREGWEKVFDEFDRILGTSSIQAFHVNDSKKGLGCRVDRHEHIGKGCIGIEAFRCLMNDPRFREVPKVLETPKENDMDVENLRVLRSLVA